MSLPNIYEQVEYIDSHGAEYINTGYLGKSTSEYNLQCRFLGGDTQQYPTAFGARSTPSAVTNASYFHIDPSGTYISYIGWGNNQYNNPFGTTSLLGKDCDITLKDGLFRLSYDSDNYDYTLSAASFNSTVNPITIFWGNFGDGASKFLIKMRLYRFTISENNEIIHDYIPVQRIADSVVGVYDLITDIFFLNSGSGSFTPGPVVSQDYYTVIYNANGGSGTMENQDIFTDVETQLRTCTFQRENYGFFGWATSDSGSVVYTDGESVLNIAETGESITLYAVWQESPLQIIIHRNQSEKNRADKTIENVITLSGSLRAETSVIEPIIMISGNVEDVVTCNYMTIPRFGRSYFITNIRSIRTGLYEISTHVDALSSFKTQIRENVAIIHKQEYNWNLYLNDGTFKVFSDSIVETYTFPTGFSGNFEYILAVAGSQNQV